MRYRVDAMFESGMKEDDFAAWIEDVLYAASVTQKQEHAAWVVDLSAYEVCHMPGWGYAD